MRSLKTSWCGFAAALCLLVGMSAAQAADNGVNLYVATNGNDAWSGRLPEPNGAKTDGPFATCTKARDTLRELRKAGPLTGGAIVWIRGGVYPQDTGLLLTKEDSGVPNGAVVYSAYKNEEVRFLGGKVVREWKPVTDPAIVKRLDPAARGHVLQADIKALGVTNFGEFHAEGMGLFHVAPMELYFQGKLMTLARWPNDGWALIAGTPQGQNGGMFTYDGDRPSRWTQAEDLWLHGYWTYDWADSYVKVKSIDPQQHAIYTEPPHGLYGYTKGHRYYALNLLEELDVPGEWYADKQTGILYFWPPEPIRPGDAMVTTLEQPLIHLKETSYVGLRGLTLEMSRGNGVVIEDGAHNLAAGCILRNLGFGGAVVLNGTDNGIKSCDVYETGFGITVYGGDRKTLTPGNNYADNNLIHDYSRRARAFCAAVALIGVGDRASHNLIYNGPHLGITISGNEHLIEYNEIHDVCRETSDVGAFYMGQDWTMRGNIVRYNYFHHLGPSRGETSSDTTAIYLDDGGSGTTVYGNVCYKAERGVLVGGGRDNTVENNLFVDCNPAVHIDARGIGWAKAAIAPGGVWKMQEKLAAVNYKNPPYSTKYPKLAVIDTEEPTFPKGNAVLHNVCLGGAFLELTDGLNDATVAVQDNYVEKATDKVAIENKRLLPADSPAFQMGFKPIPFAQIGLERDPYRPKLPGE